MNRATRDAQQRMKFQHRQDIEDRELAELEDAGGAYLSDKSTKGSIGGMLGGLGGSMLAKYLASAALTAATGGAAGPAVMAALSGLTYAAPTLGSGLGSMLGSSANAARASTEGIKRAGSGLRSKNLKGAGWDTLAGINDQLGATRMKGAMKAAAGAALLGGAGELVSKAKSAGIADLSKKIAAGGSVGDVKNINDLLKYKDAIGAGKEGIGGVKDVLGYGYNKVKGLLGGVDIPDPALTQTTQPLSGTNAFNTYDPDVLQGNFKSLPEMHDAYEQYQDFTVRSGIEDIDFQEWWDLKEAQSSTYNQQTYPPSKI